MKRIEPRRPNPTEPTVGGPWWVFALMLVPLVILAVIAFAAMFR